MMNRADQTWPTDMMTEVTEVTSLTDFINEWTNKLDKVTPLKHDGGESEIEYLRRTR
jgi:hypothetical protein